MKKIIIFSLICSSAFAFAQKQWTLQECVNYAMQNNLQVLQRDLNSKNENVNLTIAKRQYLPSVSGTAAIGSSFGQGRDIFGVTNRNDNFNNSVNVGADLLLFNHSRLAKQIRKSNYDVEASMFDTESTKNDISLQIAQQYLTILLNKEIVKISQSSLENAQKVYDRAKITTDVGTTAKTIFAEADASLAREKQNVKTSEINVSRSLFALAQLLQLPDYKNFEVVNVSVDDKLDAPLYSAESVLEKATQNQPVVKAAESRILAAAAQTEIVRTSFWPTISANAGFGTSYFRLLSTRSINGNQIPQVNFFNQGKDNFGQQVGISANIPIFNKGITRLQVEQSKINEDIANNNLQIQKQSVKENVQKAQFDAESNYEIYISSIQAEKSTALALDFAEKSYNAGRTTIYDISVARNNLANAQGSVAQAKYNYLFSLKLLNFYAGIPLSL
ncbi:TolC family protein [Halpernia frigidisoli]|uniref:Outer membrane protein n=1 Tax=Halpernia frigidisoli TaxID=1125876 RepID=A0A1I3HIC4_9FLAO|nr:TolC family protein [Halpernia frigidisoli]SFI35317.1 outer membrane protein [Halpernia frigidisoli]